MGGHNNNAGSDIPYPPPPPPLPPPPPEKSHGGLNTSQFASLINQHQNQGSHNGGSGGGDGFPGQNTKMSGVVHHQHPINISFHGTSAGAGVPGYIRINGGSTKASWNSFDANIPLSELAKANDAQQLAIYQALALGAGRPRNYHTYNNYSIDGHIDSDGYYGNRRAYAMPALLAPTSSNSNAVSGQIMPASSTAVAAAAAPPPPPPPKTCSLCHRKKNKEIDDIKFIQQSNALLCFGCVYSHFGAEFERVWYGN